MRSEALFFSFSPSVSPESVRKHFFLLEIMPQNVRNPLHSSLLDWLPKAESHKMFPHSCLAQPRDSQGLEKSVLTGLCSQLSLSASPEQPLTPFAAPLLSLQQEMRALGPGPLILLWWLLLKLLGCILP